MKSRNVWRGNIGRGFVGQLLYESGYITIFIDINEKVINALNKDGNIL